MDQASPKGNASIVSDLQKVREAGNPTTSSILQQPKTVRNVLSTEEEDIILTNISPAGPKVECAAPSVAQLEAKHAQLILEGDALMEKSSTAGALAKYDEAAEVEDQITESQQDS
jgi:hypothetical protein